MTIRRPIFVGNWKMNNSIGESIKLVTELKNLVADVDYADIVVAPPFTALYSVSIAIQDSNIQLGAQNMHWEEEGAYTGEVSAFMLQDVNCRFAILGHSERRKYFGETDERIRKKVRAALDAALTPIVCVGETEGDRKRGETFGVVESQIRGALSSLSSEDMKAVVVAYEPVWAIGTGVNATPEQAQEVHEFIRSLAERMFDTAIANGLRILYGGSVNDDNVTELMAQQDLDGTLVGGASLKSKVFASIVKSGS